jgi:hypothetical protein
MDTMSLFSIPVLNKTQKKTAYIFECHEMMSEKSGFRLEQVPDSLASLQLHTLPQLSLKQEEETIIQNGGTGPRRLRGASAPCFAATQPETREKRAIQNGRFQIETDPRLLFSFIFFRNSS